MGHIEILKAWAEENNIKRFFFHTKRLPSYNVQSLEFSIEPVDYGYTVVWSNNHNTFIIVPIIFFADMLGIDL